MPAGIRHTGEQSTRTLHGTVYDTPERQTPSLAAYPLSSPVVKSKRTPKLGAGQEKQNEMMDPSKLVPPGSLRQHAVITFK